MRTAPQCRAMADRMESRAALADEPLAREDWLAMAVYWRDLGDQAMWQDAWVGMTGPS